MTQDRIGSKELPLTHEFLAIMLGVRRPGVTDVLQSFQKKGLVNCGYGKIEILDLEALRESSCECYQAVKDHYALMVGPRQ